MKAFIVFCAVVAFAQAGVLPEVKAAVGPGSADTVVGPDGSAISAAVPGGRVITQETPGVLAQSISAAPLGAGIVSVGGTKVLQGPSSRTSVVGPDGSVIEAVAPGGQVVVDDHPAVAVAPVVAAPVAVPAIPAAVVPAAVAPLAVY